MSRWLHRFRLQQPREKLCTSLYCEMEDENSTRAGHYDSFKLTEHLAHVGCFFVFFFKYTFLTWVTNKALHSMNLQRAMCFSNVSVWIPPLCYSGPIICFLAPDCYQTLKRRYSHSRQSISSVNKGYILRAFVEFTILYHVLLVYITFLIAITSKTCALWQNYMHINAKSLVNEVVFPIKGN